MKDHFDSEEFTVDGVAFTAQFSYDCDRGYPWQEYDGMGEIRTAYSRYGKPAKKPGEIIIHYDQGQYWIYDFAATMEKAKTEEWGPKVDGLTKNQNAEKAVLRDMDYCKKWLSGDVFWCIVTVFADNDPDQYESMGGVEYENYSENPYSLECAKELAEEILYEKRKTWRKALTEARNRRYWASRDVATVAGGAPC